MAHTYTSTACHHDRHHECRLSCKFCSAHCRCSCHGVALDLPAALNIPTLAEVRAFPNLPKIVA